MKVDIPVILTVDTNTDNPAEAMALAEQYAQVWLSLATWGRTRMGLSEGYQPFADTMRTLEGKLPRELLAAIESEMREFATRSERTIAAMAQTWLWAYGLRSCGVTIDINAASFTHAKLGVAKLRR